MRIKLRRTGALGDVLNTTPIVRRLHAEYPEAMIGVETEHGYVYAGNPHIAGLTVAPARCFDRVIELDMVYERDRRMHQVAAFMREAFGDTAGDRSICLAYEDAAVPFAVAYHRAVVLHPACSWPNRTLPAAWWQRVANLLAVAGKQVVVTGTVYDHALTGPLLDLRGRLPLAGQAKLIAGAQAFLCSDSGLFTLVGATETPAVGLCTITRAEYFMPYRHGELGWNFTPIATPMPCYGCGGDEPPNQYFDCRRGDNACTASFEPALVVEQVLAAIRFDQR